MWFFNRKRARRPAATAHRSRALRPETFDRLERREVLATAAVTPFTVPAGLFGHPITVNRPVAGTPHGMPTATRVLSGGAGGANLIHVIAARAASTPGGINFGLANAGATVGFSGVGTTTSGTNSPTAISASADGFGFISPIGGMFVTSPTNTLSGGVFTAGSVPSGTAPPAASQSFNTGVGTSTGMVVI
jgi:hypothetical protein